MRNPKQADRRVARCSAAPGIAEAASRRGRRFALDPSRSGHFGRSKGNSFRLDAGAAGAAISPPSSEARAVASRKQLGRLSATIEPAYGDRLAPDVEVGELLLLPYSPRMSEGEKDRSLWFLVPMAAATVAGLAGYRDEALMFLVVGAIMFGALSLRS